LNRLDEQAAALGRGDLSVRADANEGPPEVVTLAATFNEMAVRLDELVSSQRRFVADASHQLRSPLTALRLRLEGLDPHDPAATAAGREAALAEAARLTRLVDGLLSLARAEGRRPERQHLSIAAVIEERAEAWMPLASEQHVDLDVALDRADPMTALLVPGSLEQILDNLVDNALDASPPHSAVLLSAARVGQTIEIHVIDQGAGMTDTEQRNAFEPFWRGTNGPSAVGTGLGLAIAQQLARASQGSISLERADSGGVDAIVRFAPEGVLVGT
jgi:signal transduction histidine kinase